MNTRKLFGRSRSATILSIGLGICCLLTELRAEGAESDDWVSKLQLPPPSRDAWAVGFRLSTHYAASNAFQLRNKRSARMASDRKGFGANPVESSFAALPVEIVETRHGTILVQGGQVRCDSRLVSSQPVSQHVGVSNHLTVVSKERVVRILDYSNIGERHFHAEAEFRPSDAKALSSMALPPGLIRAELVNILQSLVDVSVAEEPSAGGVIATVAGRIRALEDECGGEWTVKFDKAAGMVPVEVVHVDCDLRRTSYTYEMADRAAFRDLPVRVHCRVEDSGICIYRESWEFFDYKGVVNHGPEVFEPRIPPGYLVAEYRYSHPFSYFMGLRPPTEGELLRMSTNRNAIREYQRNSRVP